MDKDLQKYYEDRFELFSCVGWKDLLKEIQQVREQVNKVEYTHDLSFAKGQLKELDWFLRIQDITEQAYEELQDDATL